MKKMLCMLMVVAMLLGTMSFSVFADDAVNTASVEVYEDYTAMTSASQSAWAVYDANNHPEMHKELVDDTANTGKKYLKLYDDGLSNKSNSKIRLAMSNYTSDTPFTVEFKAKMNFATKSEIKVLDANETVVKSIMLFRPEATTYSDGKLQCQGAKSSTDTTLETSSIVSTFDMDADFEKPDFTMGWNTYRIEFDPVNYQYTVYVDGLQCGKTVNYRHMKAGNPERISFVADAESTQYNAMYLEYIRIYPTVQNNTLITQETFGTDLATLNNYHGWQVADNNYFTPYADASGRYGKFVVSGNDKTANLAIGNTTYYPTTGENMRLLDMNIKNPYTIEFRIKRENLNWLRLYVEDINGTDISTVGYNSLWRGNAAGKLYLTNGSNGWESNGLDFNSSTNWYTIATYVDPISDNITVYLTPDGSETVSHTTSARIFDETKTVRRVVFEFINGTAEDYTTTVYIDDFKMYYGKPGFSASTEYKADGSVINGESYNLDANATIGSATEYVNNAPDANSFVEVNTLYTDEVCSDVTPSGQQKIYPFSSISSEGSYSKSVSPDSFTTGAMLKTFVWSDLTTIKPLVKSSVLSFTK